MPYCRPGKQSLDRVGRRRGNEAKRCRTGFTYQNEKLQGRVEKLAAEAGTEIILPCEVTSDRQIDELFDRLDDYWDHVDILVHSVAYAPNWQLDGDYVDNANREGFRIAHDISSYSFLAMAKAGRHMFRPNSALLTMSYLGAVRAVPHYNVMGLAKASLEANVRYMAASLGPQQVRVNAISAGPIKTLAAKGIIEFNKLLDYGERHSPMRRNVTIEEVGNAAALPCSDLASGITGETIYVNSGYHITGMSVPETM